MLSVAVKCFTLCSINPGAELQLNPFTRCVQVPLFLQGWLAQSSISVFSGISRVNKVYVRPWRHMYPFSHFTIIPNLPRLAIMTMEVHPQVCWARVTLGHVYDNWQHLQRNGHMLPTSIKIISSEKKQLRKGLSFRFFVKLTVKDKFVVFALFQWLSIARRYLLIGSQSFVNIVALSFTRTLKVGDVICYGYLFHIVFH